jgi:beta-galactosidase
MSLEVQTPRQKPSKAVEATNFPPSVFANVDDEELVQTNPMQAFRMQEPETRPGWHKHNGGAMIPGMAKNRIDLELWRAPTDNDKGFGKWLARDWREAGLTDLSHQMGPLEFLKSTWGEMKYITVESNFTAVGGMETKTIWTWHVDGSVEMDKFFTPFGKLPYLGRVGIVLPMESGLDRLSWYGRGPWENYPDRKESADMGVWSRTVEEQYVPYLRPQENGNKEDVRWLVLQDGRHQLKIETLGEPFSFSTLHYTANDLTSARHNYELQPRPEVILTINAKMSGLGNSSCGPGVLEKYAVPPKAYRLHLRFSPQ